MKITGHGFQVFLLVAIAAAGSSQIVTRWPLPASGAEAAREALNPVQSPVQSIESFLDTTACAATGAAWTVAEGLRQDSTPSLRQSAGNPGPRIGAAVEPGLLAADANYRSTVSREFNTLTPENVMKFDHIHPAPQSFDFCDSDALVSYAAANHMQVRGHTLVWHQQLPEWLSRGEFSRDELIAILRNHIQTVVGRYRGQVWAWDVVNEAFESDGSLRDSLWLRGIGPEYIEMAFGWAHEADPEALLFYNDYAAEGMGAKSDAIYALLGRLRGRGVAVHGAGLQMHLEAGKAPARDEIARNMTRLAALGLEIHVTEMDVRVALPVTAAKLRAQAETYRDVVGACVAVQACRSITFWGVTDSHSWIASTASFAGFGSALLLDEAYGYKPAYQGVRDALEGGAVQLAMR
jgi:endo-1,4-beta-xylanase